MEITFGAVGDIISVGTLIVDLIELLDDSRGASWEYQALLEQLKILNYIICQADSARRKNDWDSPELRDTARLLFTYVEEARRRIEGVVDKIRKYSSSLSPGGSGNVAKDVGMKLRWRMNQKEVEKFRDDLIRYCAHINMVLSDARNMYVGYFTTVPMTDRSCPAS